MEPNPTPKPIYNENYDARTILLTNMTIKIKKYTYLVNLDARHDILVLQAVNKLLAISG
jgi:hypothetical protein